MQIQNVVGNNQYQKLMVWKPQLWVNEHFDEKSQVGLERDYQSLVLLQACAQMPFLLIANHMTNSLEWK